MTKMQIRILAHRRFVMKWITTVTGKWMSLFNQNSMAIRMATDLVISVTFPSHVRFLPVLF